MEQSNKKFFYIIAALAVLLIGMYAWKAIAIKNIQKANESQRLQLVEKHQQDVTEKTRYFLNLTTTPFVWAIRKEMLKENYEQINEYLIQFVKNPRIKQIIVVKSDGTVAVSTDKKLEGAPFSSLYPQEFLEKTESAVSNDDQGNILIISPIMGFDKNLGTFLMVYQPEKGAVQ